MRPAGAHASTGDDDDQANQVADDHLASSRRALSPGACLCASFRKDHAFCTE
ncbi:hypothetical protein [Amycolatopsis magusensis]|uniref:hypothetical protein n=1 Tax=Amycolatopsis magusensis TaxID=882444 RepID=UPI00379F30BB